MSNNWTARVERINPATDALIIKVTERINQEQAQRIRRQVAAVWLEVKTLVLDSGSDFAIVKRRRSKTLVKAGRRR